MEASCQLCRVAEGLSYTLAHCHPNEGVGGGCGCGFKAG
jgi:hypothetical protein